MTWGQRIALGNAQLLGSLVVAVGLYKGHTVTAVLGLLVYALQACVLVLADLPCCGEKPKAEPPRPDPPRKDPPRPWAQAPKVCEAAGCNELGTWQRVFHSSYAQVQEGAPKLFTKVLCVAHFKETEKKSIEFKDA